MEAVMEGKTDIQKLGLSFLKLIIILASLYLINLFMSAVHVFDNVRIPDSPISLLKTITGMLTIAGIMFVMNFAYQFEEIVSRTSSRLPELGKIGKNLLFIACATHAYFAFQPIIIPLVTDFVWFYQITFLVLFVVLLLMIALDIYQNLDKISLAIVYAFSSRPVEVKQEQADENICRCPKCNEYNNTEARFCLRCGEKLKKEEAPKSFTCPKCNFKVEKWVRFCPECGSKIS
jgi:hypothetical protein